MVRIEWKEGRLSDDPNSEIHFQRKGAKHRQGSQKILIERFQNPKIELLGILCISLRSSASLR
jgi:hypothetical protein